MTVTDSVLAGLSESLVMAVNAGDTSRLREYLEGDLPAIGGDHDPADILLRALQLTKDYPLLSSQLASLLSRAVTEMAEEAKQSGESLSPQTRHSLISALYLAAELPANRELFDSLHQLFSIMWGSDAFVQFRIPLLQALVYGQVDASLETLWLKILQGSTVGEWIPALRTLLLTAWRGLLWIPPWPGQPHLVAFDRIEAGLLALAAVSDQPGSLSLLRAALDILSETYPRSVDYWQTHFETRSRTWPESLRQEFARKWPPQKEPLLQAPIENRRDPSLLQESQRPRRSSEIAPEIRQAYEARVPVEALVTGLNKGGAEVQLYGMRAFCPLSQLDLRYVENPEKFIGQKLTFKINRLEEGNRGGRGPNIVLSRRQLLEEEQQARAAETRQRLRVGATLKGKITSLTSYGAFIDLGGIEGFLHVSEIGHSRTAHPRDVFTIGQEVEVQVIKIEKGKDAKRPERISLSRRSLERDPWRDAVSRFPEGTETTGRVVRLESFGAFVELAPGLEGLVHISEMGAGRRLNHAREAVQLGQDVEVKVLGVDTNRRRISLSMETVAAADFSWSRETSDDDEEASRSMAFERAADLVRSRR